MTDNANTDSDAAELIGLFEAMRTTRSIRRFSSEVVPAPLITRAVEAASWAPTGGNLQQWRVVIVQDHDLRASLGRLYRRAWDTYASTVPAEPAQHGMDDRMLTAALYLVEHFGDAPGIAVFCHYPGLILYTDATLDRPSVIGGASLYPAVQNFLLALRGLGLGGVATTILCYVEAEVNELLGLPDTTGIHAVVPFGYPANERHGPLTRRPVERLAHADRWGVPWQEH